MSTPTPHEDAVPGPEPRDELPRFQAEQPRRTSDEPTDFRSWRDSMPSFEVDGTRLYLPSGDVPVDEAELADHWSQLHSNDQPG